MPRRRRRFWCEDVISLLVAVDWGLGSLRVSLAYCAAATVAAERRDTIGSMEPARLLFPVAYYDGPISGLATYGDQVVWFDGDPHEGRWSLYRLEPEEIIIELEAKGRFEDMVGTHWSYDVLVAERRQRAREMQMAYYADRDSDDLPARRDRYQQPTRLIGDIAAWASYR